MFTPFPPNTPPHDDAATQALTKFWVDWMEAGRLWMSWWVNALPNPPWPPAGMLLPPVEEPGKTLPPMAGVPPQGRGAVAAKPTTPTRAAGARHH